MKPVVLVTRPAEEALRTAMALAEHGYDFLIEPLLEIAPLPDADARLAAVGDAAALLFTSANGVRGYAAATPRRDLPAYAVGGMTAEAARASGFAQVHVAGGDVESLAALVARERKPGDGALLHIAGEHVAGDLAGRLGALGFQVRTVALYTARAAEGLSAKARDTLASGGLGAALFFSPRTARTFVSLVRTGGLDTYCRSCVAVCLSPAVAEAAGVLAWRAVVTAGKPGEGAGIGAMIDALMPVLPGEGGEPAGEGSAMTDTDKKTIALPAAEVIQRFGGIRPMAAKLGISFSTVQGWKERDHIPEQRHAEIAALAAKHGVSLEGPGPAAIAVPSSPEKPAGAPSFRQVVPPPGPGAAPGDKPPPIPPPLVAHAAPAEVSGLGVMGAAFVSLVIVGAAFAGAYLTRDQWLGEIASAPALAPAQPSVDRAVLDAFAARLAKLEKDIAARPAGAAADPKLAGDILAFDKRLTELQNALYAAREQAKRDAQAGTATLSEVAQAAKAAAAEQAKAAATLAQRVEALEKGIDPAAFIAVRNGLNDLSAKLDALAKRMEAAERVAASARAEGMAQAAFALSVGQLRRAVDSGAPFAAELAACRSLAGADAALAEPLDRLAPLAAAGVATRAALAQSFKQAAASVVHAGRARDGESGAWRRVLAWLDSLITVRPVGAAAGDSPAARTARAEAKLGAGDLAGAVAELGALAAPAADAAKPWLDRAKARLQADQALAALESRAAAAVARK